MEIIQMIHEIKEQNEIKIFNPTFVENNKGKIKIVIENKKSSLSDKCTIENKNKKYLKIKLLVFNKNNLNFSYMLKDITSLKKFYVISGKDDDTFESELEKIINDTMNDNFKDKKKDFNNENVDEKGAEMENNENESLSFYKSISKRIFFTINEISSIAKASSHFSIFSSISKEYNVLCSSFYNFSVRKRISVINLSNLFNGCSLLELIKDINFWKIENKTKY